MVVDDSKEGREKRAKNLCKKLKAIQEIRAKLVAGQPLEPEQVRCTFTFENTLFLSIVHVYSVPMWEGIFLTRTYLCGTSYAETEAGFGS